LRRSLVNVFPLRWYFWLVIGIIASFMVVMVYFTVRGLIRYRHVYLLARKQTGFVFEAQEAVRRTGQGAYPNLRVKYNPRYAQPHANMGEVV
jgi:hypothetical protein